MKRSNMSKYVNLNKPFFIGLLVFFCLNLTVYSFILYGHSAVTFNQTKCRSAYRYFKNCKDWNENYYFVRSLGVWDAQWYLKIAENGYPTITTFLPTDKDQKPTYAFFPLYPSVLHILNGVFHHTELTAFILSNILLLTNYSSLYYVIAKLYSSELAHKTTLLLFLFPLSIYYRSYYPEGLFLCLLIWFSYCLIKRKWWLTTLLLSLLYLTRPNGLFLVLPFTYFLLVAISKRNMSIFKAILLLVCSLIPFSLWLALSHLQTGNYLAFTIAEKVWFTSPSILHTFQSNLQTILNFPKLPFHSYNHSKIDDSIFVITLLLVIKSRKFLKAELWLTSLVFLLLPLLVRDLASYSRYQIVSFPIFLYLASKLKGISFYLVTGVFYISLLFVSLYFVNWYWIE